MNRYRTERPTAVTVGILYFLASAATSTRLPLLMGVQEIVLADWLIARGFGPLSADAVTLERSPSWTLTPVS